VRIDPPFTALRLTEAERAASLDRVRPGVSAEDYQLIEGMSHALPQLLDLIAQDATLNLRKLRQLLFGPKTEKTDQVCPPLSPLPPGDAARAENPGDPPAPRRLAADLGHRLPAGTSALRHLWRAVHCLGAPEPGTQK
jgi:hypothetical protein